MAREDILITLLTMAVLLLLVTQAALFITLRKVSQKVDDLLASGQEVMTKALAVSRAIPTKMVPIIPTAFFLLRKLKHIKKEA